MAPFTNVTCQTIDSTSNQPADLGKDDLNALLYIVVTLLFYSMGIIIGIITYLKREQADMEEDQMFDLYLSLKQEPFNVHKQERVRQMAVYLKQIEEAKLAREKIEAWNAEQNQKSRSSTADCAQGIPSYETSFSFPGASGTAADIEKGRGASAFLCSLTLGVCEPLLTPEGTISKAAASSRNIPMSLYPGSAKGRTHGQRHSMPSMNNTDIVGKGILREKQRSCRENRSAFKLPSKLKISQSIIELQDLKRSTIDQDQSDQDDDNDDYSVENYLRGNLSHNNETPLKTISFPNNENIPAFKRAAFASDLRKYRVTLSDQMSSDKESDIPDIDSSRQSLVYPSSRYKKNMENDPCSIVITSEHLTKSDISLDKNKEMIASNYKEDVSLKNPAEPTPILNIPLEKDKGALFKKHSLCEPLTLDETLLRPFSDTADVRSKLCTNSLTNIPRDVTHSMGKDGLSPDKRRSLSPRYDSWRKGGVKTVDIPDSRILQGRKNEKRHERRGALLFTQKSLHHIENEMPKPGSAKRVIGHQESTDSYSSRNTDSTDVGESPQLLPAFDRSQGTSGSSEPHPAARRQERRIPKLIRSKTVDSSKSPPL